MIWLFLFLSLTVLTFSLAVMITRFNRYMDFPLWHFTLGVLGVMFGMYGVTLSILYLLFR
jgi:hypothetical protein